jgi:subtilisin family serine protease
MKTTLWRGLVVVGLLLTLTATVWGADESEASFHPGRVLVKFKHLPSGSQLRGFALENGLKLDRAIPKIGVFRFMVSGGERVENVVRRLKGSDLVEFCEPDFVRFASHIPNDTLYSQQWDMTLIGMPAFWDLEKGEPEVIVAVLDTGIDLDHPDLVNQLWINADEIPGDGLDNDGNGYADDRNGYDFAGNGWLPLEGAHDPIPEDAYVGHGTHVSGTIAAQQDNATGISGEAPGTKLMAVRVLGGLLGTGYSSDICEGIIYATDNGASVINMSLGGGSSSLAEYNALKYAWDHNVFIAAASGNEGNSGNPLSYPACYVFTMSVGATDSGDIIAPFSTYNEFVEVCAPGVTILSTVPGGGYESAMWSGTSMATPHVAGLAALLYSTYSGIQNWQVRAMLQAGIVDCGTAGWDKYYGYGRVNVAQLLLTPTPSPDELQILTPPNGAGFRPVSLVALLWTPVTGAAKYRITAALPGGGTKVIQTTVPYYTVPSSQTMPKGTYLVTVQALTGLGAVLSSDVVTFTRF